MQIATPHSRRSLPYPARHPARASSMIAMMLFGDHRPNIELVS
jgi:hypothetical protein